jgi:predicted membrane-bound spermidine synthase
LIVTALSAACGLIVEITAGRMLAPYLGMSLYTWTAVIAVVLAGFSVGHWVGGRVAERQNDQAHRIVVWSLIGAALTSAGAIVLIRQLSGPVLSLELSAVPTILLLTTLIFFLPSLFVGIPSPVLTKLAIDEEPELMARTLGAFYATSALGSILGTLSAGYIFISWLGTVWTFILVAVGYAAMAIILVWVGPARLAGAHGIQASKALPTITLLCGAAIVLLAGLTNAFKNPCNRESAYFCIRVIDEIPTQFGAARTLVLDHLAHGTNVRNSAVRLITPYVELQDKLARIHTGRSSPFRAFFVGGGAYTLPRAWLARRRDAELAVAEIDPAVTEMAIKRLWLNGSDKRLSILHEDARTALAKFPDRHFDVIVGDAFHDIAVPQHLVTREFFELVASRLSGEGIYIMNVVDLLENPKLVLSIVATLRNAFSTIEVWRLNESGRRTTFVVTGLKRATEYKHLPSSVHADVSFTRLGKEMVARLEAAMTPVVMTDDFAPVDRLIGVQ